MKQEERKENKLETGNREKCEFSRFARRRMKILGKKKGTGAEFKGERKPPSEMEISRGSVIPSCPSFQKRVSPRPRNHVGVDSMHIKLLSDSGLIGRWIPFQYGPVEKNFRKGSSDAFSRYFLRWRILLFFSISGYTSR